MSSEPVDDLDPDGYAAWLVSSAPLDLLEYDDALEESSFEAAVCGDAGFEDRMERLWWAGLDELDDEPPPGGTTRVPADPLERLGRVGWLEARAQEINREHARFVAAVREVGHAHGRVDDAGRPRPDAYAADQVGQVLGHSRSKAAWWLSVATAVIDRLPRLHAAMAAGNLDLAKATVFVEGTRDMPRDLAMSVVDRVLPGAVERTNRQLAEHIEITACQLDGDWYRRREQAALARARVEFARNPAGTGEVALRDVSARATVTIKARVDALAEPLRHAARRARLRLGLPALRALAGQRLLDGTYAGLDDDALLDALIEELPAWYVEITGEDDPGDGGPGRGGPGRGGPGDGGPDGGGPDGGGPDGGGAGSDGHPDDDPTDEVPADEAPADEAPADEVPADEASPAGARSWSPATRVGTVELRMRLSTALGVDDLPGELPGSGPLSARSARRMLGEVRGGATPTEWRMVLVDDDGYLAHVLLARPDQPRRRCRTPGPARGPTRRVRGQVIVELAAPTALLATLDPDDHHHWAGLIRRAQTQLAGLVEQGAHVGGPNHPATSVTDARRRFPGAALARFVRVRDRFCVGPLCRGVAHDADLDHTRDWASHGLTVAGNLGPPCRYCHRLKHEGGWQLTQPSPGTFRWRSPLGATTLVEARRVLEPAADPAPRTDGRARPVLHAHRPPGPLDRGWIDKHVRMTGAEDDRTPRMNEQISRCPDGPPF